MRSGRLLLAALLALVPLLTSAPAMSHAAVAEARLSVSLSSVSPLVAQGNQPVTVTGTISNTGSTSAPATDVVVRSSSTGMQSRAAIADWARSTTAADGPILGKVRTSGPIAAGQTVRFTIRVNNLAAGQRAAWGAIAVSIEAGDARTHTFLGFQRTKEYVPLNVSLSVPVVLPANPVLWGDGATRSAAWTALADSSSRLNRIMAATDRHRVNWIVDDSLLTPAALAPGSPPASEEATAAPPTPSLTPSSPGPVTTTPTMTYADSAAEVAARATLRTRVLAGSATHGTWTVPAGDPDVAALAGLNGMTALVAEDVSASATTLTGRSLVAWPQNGAWSDAIEESAHEITGPTTPAIVSSDAVAVESATFTPSSQAVSENGTPLMIADAPLSATLTRAASANASATDIQRFMADSASVLGEQPGTSRSVNVVADRSIDPNVARLNAFLSGVSSIPWLTLGAAVDAPGGQPLPAKPAERAPALTASPLTSDALIDQSAKVVALSDVRGDGLAFDGRWSQTILALTGTSWRGQATSWQTLQRSLVRTVDTALDGVMVEPKQINFLADTGRIQITVVNALDVPVKNISLRVTPDSPKLRIDEPVTQIEIGARARTTVTLTATALAAGVVPLRTTLVAPDGTLLTDDAPVEIRVTPTGNWIYVVVGALALVTLLAGIWRSRRARRATSPATPIQDGNVAP